jgi:hypothetical protein
MVVGVESTLIEKIHTKQTICKYYIKIKSHNMLPERRTCTEDILKTVLFLLLLVLQVIDLLTPAWGKDGCMRAH